MNWFRTLVLTLGLFGLAAGSSATAQQCLTCDFRTIFIDNELVGQHRLDSTGDTYVECSGVGGGDGHDLQLASVLHDPASSAGEMAHGSDPSCHNDWDDGSCTSDHPPCGGIGLQLLKTEVDRLLATAQGPNVPRESSSSTTAAVLLERIQGMSALTYVGRHGAIQLRDCQGVVVAEWRAPIELRRLLSDS